MKHLLLLLIPLFILFSCSEEDSLPAVDCSQTDLMLMVTSQTPATCDNDDGTILTEASGGSGGYSFRVDNGQAQSTSLIEGLSAGAHTITLTDASDCEVSVEVFVDEISGISFSRDIQPILTNNCTLPTCHVAGTSRQDFTLFDRVQQLSEEIKRRTQTREMPLNGSITQRQINLIECWVDEGALDN
jgi:hypothetical protein